MKIHENTLKKGAESERKDQPSRQITKIWFIGMTPRLPGVFYAARDEARKLSAAIKQNETLKMQKVVIPLHVLSAH